MIINNVNYSTDMADVHNMRHCLIAYIYNNKRNDYN